MRAPEPVPLDDPRLDGLRQLLGVIDRLRAPDGCPWDRKQTEASMAPYAVEEAHEWVEAIESGDAEAAAGEAGDTLLAVLMTCRIAEEGGRYDAGVAARRCAEKLVTRHPHVFGDERADTEAEVLATWEERKRAERAARGEDPSALAGIPAALPALMAAARTSSKATSGIQPRSRPASPPANTGSGGSTSPLQTPASGLLHPRCFTKCPSNGSPTPSR